MGNSVTSTDSAPAGPRRNTVRALLSRWRAAERRLRATPPGSPERANAVEEFEAARLAYQEAAEAGDE